MKLILSMSCVDFRRLACQLEDYKGGILFSYMDLRKKMDYILPTLIKLRKKNPKLFVMVDSGAHSFLYMYGKTVLKRSMEMGHGINQEVIRIVKSEGIEKYISNYTNFMYRYQNVFDCFVELDLQSMYGMDVIENWRTRFNRSSKGKLMVVWHGESNKILEQWCKDYTFIGLGGTGAGANLRSPKFIQQVTKRYPDNKFHLFAMTDNKLSKYSETGLFSADSTSWSLGKRFGLFYYFEKGQLYGESKYFLRRDNNRADMVNLLAWKQFGNYLNDIGRFR